MQEVLCTEPNILFGDSAWSKIKNPSLPAWKGQNKGQKKLGEQKGREGIDPQMENRVCKDVGRWMFGNQSTKVLYTWMAAFNPPNTFARLAWLLPPFTDRETEVPRGQVVIFLSSCSSWLEPGVEARQSDSRACNSDYSTACFNESCLFFKLRYNLSF